MENKYPMYQKNNSVQKTQKVVTDDSIAEIRTAKIYTYDAEGKILYSTYNGANFVGVSLPNKTIRIYLDGKIEVEEIIKS